MRPTRRVQAMTPLHDFSPVLAHMSHLVPPHLYCILELPRILRVSADCTAQMNQAGTWTVHYQIVLSAILFPSFAV